MDSGECVQGPTPSEFDIRVSEIVEEFQQRFQSGDAKSVEDFLTGYASMADTLRPHLEIVARLNADRNAISDLVAHGILRESEGAVTLHTYLIERVIGNGGMGIVLQAYEPKLDRRVALKILTPRIAELDHAEHRFTREALAAARMHDPRIVSVFALGEKPGPAYIAMEYVEGPSLAQVLHRGKALPTKDVRFLFKEIILGLRTAHAAGVIHRDLKPANILLPRAQADAQNQTRPLDSMQRGSIRAEADCWASPPEFNRSDFGGIKIADFGIALTSSALTRLTRGTQTPGTPAYMSPEQIRGAIDIDHRTDLYSAGVVLYEMLTGCVPFDSDTPVSTIHRVLHDPPPDPRTHSAPVDRRLAEIALRLLAKNRDQRFKSADDVLEALSSGTRIELPEHRRLLRRKRLRVFAIGIVVTLVAGWGIRAGRPPTLTDVQVDEDTKLAVQARYGSDPTWRTLAKIPPRAQRIEDYTLCQTAEDRAIVAVGLLRPLQGDSLIAFHSNGKEAWRFSAFSERRWPDTEPATEFGTRCLAAGDLDGNPGDELVAVSQNIDEYPSCVDIIDPATGQSQSRFWHLGHIHSILIAEDFLGPGHAAIIIEGQNNKLDGFSTTDVGCSPEATSNDKVPFVAILDPQNMNGEGPPPLSCDAAERQAVPHAYAFFDLAAGKADITSLTVEDCPDAPGSAGCVKVSIQTAKSNANLTFDDELTITRSVSGDLETWRILTHTIVRNKQYTNAWRSASDRGAPPGNGS